MLSLDHEHHLFQQGYPLVAGIDEAGRGPLAGPVIAAVVILDKNFYKKFHSIKILQEINDSKKITSKKREEIIQPLWYNCNQIGIGVVHNNTIDRINILQASFLAMKKALSSLKEKPNIILLDGQFPLPNCSYKQEAIKGGDTSIFSIAAASIVAKVTRDKLMEKFHQKYPNYGFDRHKGYGTKKHIEYLTRYGPCPIHRRSFKPVAKKLEIGE